MNMRNMRNMMNMMNFKYFMQNLSEKIVLYFSLAIFSAITLLNYIGIISFQNLIKFNNLYEVIILIIISMVLVLSATFLYKVKCNKLFPVYLFLFAFIIRLIWILSIDTQPISDFKIMYDGAMDIVNGNKDALLNNYYFNTWVYQLGYTMFLAILLKIFSGSLLALKIVNTIIICLIPVIIYLIINKLTLEKYARISSILYSIYISSIINSSVLTNQNLATLLFYLALYILIINIKHKWILVGITLGLGNIIRPEAPIILIAIFLFLIFRDFTDFRIIKKNILSFIGILFTFIIITKGASFLILKSGYTEYHLSNRDPLWKITCGLNPDTKGTYSHDDLVFLSQFEDRNEGHKTLITTRLDNPVSLLVTMASKTVPMWASNDTSISFAFSDNIDNTNLYNALLKLEKIQYIIIITFALLGVINMIREKSKFNYSFLFLIILIGYFLAHLILEVQPRYRYFAIPIFFIMAAYGFTKSKLTYKFLKE